MIEQQRQQTISSNNDAVNRAILRADIWSGVFREAHLSPQAIVLELCPGESTKIGDALRSIAFSGTLYVVEQSELCCRNVSAEYQRILPKAEIRVIQRSLQTVASELPPTLDAIVANHPLDDLILGEFVAESEWEQIWGSVYRNREDSARQIADRWRSIANQPEALKLALESSADHLSNLRAQLNPSFFAIYQYPSTTLAEVGLDLPTANAEALLKLLRAHIGENSPTWFDRLRRLGLEPGHWLVQSEPITFKESIQEAPAAIRRLHADVFVELPAFQRTAVNAEATLAYDERLAARYFTPNLSRVAVRQALADAFTLDLEAVRTESLQSKTVYVDRQADPSGIALGPNLGSGRAAYVGQHWNLKGIGRTPLAKSEPSSIHGTGRLNFMKGAWEMITANTCYFNLSAGASPVLAVEKLDRSFTLKDREWAAVNAVREDYGSLDRPSHFTLPQLHSQALDLEQLAKDLGRLDAEQFTERIVHNAWSLGNVSASGQLIDFDTVSGVRGRCPHFSYSSGHPEVLFGLERGGRLKTLQTILENNEPFDAATFERLRSIFEESRHAMLRQGVLKLLGFSREESIRILQDYAAPLAILTEQFELLAGKMNPDCEALDLMKRKRSPALFDFSRLFRFLPLLRTEHSDRTLLRGQAELLLTNSIDPAKESAHPKLALNTQAVLDSRFIVRDVEELEHCRLTARQSINTLIFLLDETSEMQLPSSARQRALRAYKVNEDRRAMDIGIMMPWLARLDALILRNAVTPSHIHCLLNACIEANDRRTVPDEVGELTVDTLIGRDSYRQKVIQRDGLIVNREYRFTPDAGRQLVTQSHPYTLIVDQALTQGIRNSIWRTA